MYLSTQMPLTVSIVGECSSKVVVQSNEKVPIVLEEPVPIGTLECMVSVFWREQFSRWTKMSLMVTSWM